MNEKRDSITEVTRAWSENKPPRYTLKKDGRYYSANGAARGFMAHGIGACYSFPLAEAKALQSTAGGEVVEVVSLGNFRFTEKDPAMKVYKAIARVPRMPEMIDWYEAATPDAALELWRAEWAIYGSPMVKVETEILEANEKDTRCFYEVKAGQV